MKSLSIFASLLLCISMSASAEVLNYKKVTALAKEVLENNNFSLVTDKIDDIEDFCPNYNKFDADEKEYFFAHLAAQMSIYESEFDTNTTFLENNGNISAGLMGISSGSLAPVYKDRGCNVIKVPEDLKNAKKNLICGFAIMSKWTNQHNYLAHDNKTGASIYWSTLRPPYKTDITVMVKGEKTKKIVTVGKKLLIIAGIKKEYSKCY